MSFFKVPIDKVAAQLSNKIKPGEKVILNKSQQAMVKGLKDNRFWVHISARRTGKSYAASIVAFAKLLEPGQQVTIVAPNYSLSSIIWDYVTGFIIELGLETEKFNAKDKVVKLINGSVFRLLSANNRDSLVGRAFNLLIIDEAAIIPDDEYFRRDLRPALSTYDDSRALFITTPRGKANYIYDYFCRGEDESYPEWGSAKFDWTSNPYLNKADIEESKHSMTHNLFMQEFYCDWTVFEGQIYSVEEDKHVKDLIKLLPKDPTYEFIAGLDMGYRDETAFIVIATNGKVYNIVDYYISKESTTSTYAEYIKEKEEFWGIENIYIDSAAAQAKADLAYDYDIYCDNAVKSVEDGIAFIQNLVEKDNIIFDRDKCYPIFQSMGAYRWNMNTEKQKPLHDQHSHACDAIRYAIYSHQKNRISIFSG